MKSEDIIQLINNPSSLNEDSEKQLKSLLEDYPYFQTAHLLYLMNLHAGKDSEFNSELRKTACYAVDRKKLYFLVNEEQFTLIQINRLEKKEKTLQLDSSFDLIDFFLNEKSSGKGFAPETVSSISGNKSEKLISSDYISYLLSDDVKYNETELVPMQHQDAIDEFLRKDAEEPVKIHLKDTDGPSGPVLPDLNAAEEDGFFSETLAKIYIRQKKYVKALEIIRKLHLLYPEKNIYFADQIRFLEKLIINIKKT